TNRFVLNRLARSSAPISHKIGPIPSSVARAAGSVGEKIEEQLSLGHGQRRSRCVPIEVKVVRGVHQILDCFLGNYDALDIFSIRERFRGPSQGQAGQAGRVSRIGKSGGERRDRSPAYLDLVDPGPVVPRLAALQWWVGRQIGGLAAQVGRR